MPLTTLSTAVRDARTSPWPWWGFGLAWASLGFQSLAALPTLPFGMPALLLHPLFPWVFLCLIGLCSVMLLHRSWPIAWQAGVHVLLAVILGVGFCWASALQGLVQRVPVFCHNQTLTTTWVPIQRELRLAQAPQQHKFFNGMADQPAINTFTRTAEYIWHLKHLQVHPCLAQGSVVAVRLGSANAPQLQIGQPLQATVKLRSTRATLPLQGFDANRALFMSGVAGWGSVLAWQVSVPGEPTIFANTWVHSLTNTLKQQRMRMADWLMYSLNQHPQQGLMMALVLGDQGLISAPERALYADAGIAHLVAISGLHITMLASLMGWLVARLWRLSPNACLRLPAPWVGRWAGVGFALLYAALAGWGIPAQRTVWMLAAWALAHQRTVHCSPWWPWWVAWCFCLLSQPFAVLDTGFVLSFGAVAVLIFAHHGRMVLRPAQLHLVGKSWAKRLAWAYPFVYTQGVVTVGLLVPSAVLFNQVSVASLWVNVLSIPWMSLVSTPLALLGGFLGHHGLLHLAAHSLALQASWLAWVDVLAWSTWWVPVQPGWIYVLAMLGGLLCLLPRGVLPKLWGGLLGLMLMALLAWPAPRPKPGEFWVDVLDVGQGNALVVRTHKHTLLYDTGPATGVNQDSGLRHIMPWMRQQGVRQLDALWVSHADNDHAGGAATVLGALKVQQFVHSMTNAHPLAALAIGKAIPNHNCHTQAAWVWDNVVFEPVKRLTMQESTTAHSSDNNQSCVLRIRTAGYEHSLLLAGDIEQEAEWQLLRDHPQQSLQARVLLVPHHGSLTSSTPQWLDAVQPELAIVQSGWKNRYGHPHPTVLTRYQRRNIAVYNTAQEGALALQFAPQNPQWKSISALQKRQRFWHPHGWAAQPP